MGYKLTVPLALFGFLPYALCVFAVLPPRKAVLVVLFSGWMFLPPAEYSFEGIPDYGKETAISLGLLLGVMIFDLPSLLALRPRWYDFPVWAIAAGSMITSLTNDLGVYNGLSSILGTFITIGIPYYMGRIYFADYAGLRELAIAFFIAGLVYIPFVLWEVRMSPNLCSQIYGFRARPFNMAIRMGGYRPEVFMVIGIAMALWLGSGLLCGFWLWFTGAVQKVGPVPMKWAVPVLFLTFLFCRSGGAYALFLLGVAVLLGIKFLRFRTLALLLLLLPSLLYVSTRSSGAWSGQELVDFSKSVFGSSGEERSGSLAWRMRQENLLRERCWQRPIFGWGGFGRDREGIANIRGLDSLWLITIGQRGVFGLACMALLVYLPLFMLRSRLPARLWTHPTASGTVVCSLVLALWSLDCLFNGFSTPINFAISGGLMGLKSINDY